MSSTTLLHVAFLLAWIAAAAGQAQTPAPTPAPASHADGKEQRSYYPLAVGNWWSYRLTVYSGTRKTTRVKWSVTQRQIIDGAAVYHVWPTPPEGDEPLSLKPGESGIALAGSGRVLLKNSLQAGDHWSSGFEVVSAGKACTVAENSFDDCAVIRESDKATGYVTLTTYARGVGPVAFTYFKGLDGKKLDTKMTILAWHVK